MRPVQNTRVVGCWCGYLSGARCRLAYGPADATATAVSCFSKIQIGFTFLVPAHPGSPGQRAVKRMCVCNSRLDRPVCIYSVREKTSVVLLSDSLQQFAVIVPCSYAVARESVVHSVRTELQLVNALFTSQIDPVTSSVHWSLRGRLVLNTCSRRYRPAIRHNVRVM